MSDSTGSIVIDGLRRHYLVHTPTGRPSAPCPTVIALHGRNASADEMRRTTRLDAIADRNGFAVVYPEGYGQSWNDSRDGTAAARSGTDDVAFIARLIERLIESGIADPDRIGAAGMSNGAVMCHRLGLELGDRIAAIATVAGSLPPRLAAVVPEYAVSALLIHGDDDRISPITGGDGHFGGGAMLPVADAVDRWCVIDQALDRTPLEPFPATPADPTSIERVCYTGGVGGAVVEYWKVQGGGHTWPGAPARKAHGATSRHFDAGEAIAEFLLEYALPASERRRSSRLPSTPNTR